MRRGYADTSHGQMHFQTAGEGAPLVLLHASPRSSRVFAKLIPLLAKNHRVIAFDTLGFGASDPLPDKFTMESLADLVVEAMDNLGLKKADLLGYHTGNKIGTALAANHPDRVSRFVLVGMTHSLVLDRATRDAAILNLVGKGLKNDSDNASDDNSGDNSDGTSHKRGAALLREWAKTFSAVSEVWWKPDVIGKTSMTLQDLDALEREVLDKIQARSSFDPIYRANFKFDMTEALTRISTPTLILELATAGEEHLGKQGEAMRSLMKAAELIVLPDTDRSVWDSDPGAIAEPVLRFLSAK